MISTPPGLILVNRKYEDVDEFTSEAKRWDLEFQQLDAGRFEGDAFQVVAGRMMICEGRYRRVLQQTGTAPPDVLTFAIAGGENVRYHWRNMAIAPNDMVIFPASEELHCASLPDFHIFTISLPENAFARVVDQAEVGKLILALENERISCPRPAIRRLRAVLRRFVGAIRTNSALLQDFNFVREFEQEIPRRLVAAMTDDQASCPPCESCGRTTAIRKAVAVISQHEFQALTVFGLCEAIGVSERTLQYAFMEHFGVTPKDYLKAIHLMGVRRGLKASTSENASISEAASNWGFWNMGQFAADYRKQFGELPSETLRRRAS